MHVAFIIQHSTYVVTVLFGDKWEVQHCAVEQVLSTQRSIHVVTVLFGAKWEVQHSAVEQVLTTQRSIHVVTVLFGVKWEVQHSAVEQVLTTQRSIHVVVTVLFNVDRETVEETFEYCENVSAAVVVLLNKLAIYSRLASVMLICLIVEDSTQMFQHFKCQTTCA